MSEAEAGWPLPFRLIHWASAVLVIATLGYGVYMVQLVHNTGERFELTQTHKSLGVAVLVLTIARLCLRLFVTAPAPESTTSLLILAAKAAHAALYALLLMMPLSGWLMATTTPVRVPTFAFNFLQLPYPLAPNLPIYQFAHAIHVGAAIGLALLVAVHVAAAMIHALLWRDRTLDRMWRRARSAA
jgi:cytochrome b561